MTDEEDAVIFVKQNKNSINSKFADLKLFTPVKNPICYFMAGSPGAGKTEFSKNLVELISHTQSELKIIRIDVDEIRHEIPQFRGNNSSVVQHAAALAARNLFYFVVKNNQNFIFDGTLSSESVIEDIKMLINKGKRVGIFYIYQDPKRAWEFTKKREKIEGRPVPKDVFIKAFFESRSNVNKIKEMFGKDITLTFIEKNYLNKDKKYRPNIDKVESFVENKYNPNTLEQLLKNKI